MVQSICSQELTFGLPVSNAVFSLTEWSELAGPDSFIFFSASATICATTSGGAGAMSRFPVEQENKYIRIFRSTFWLLDWFFLQTIFECKNKQILKTIEIKTAYMQKLGLHLYCLC